MPTTTATEPPRAAVLRSRVRLIVALTIAYKVIEAVIAITAAEDVIAPAVMAMTASITL
jgi:hypothetical protein